MTRASLVRSTVAALDEQGKTPTEIASATGLSLARVERVLELLDGPLDEEPYELPPPAAPVARRPRSDAAVCGTIGGYRAHLRRQETTCAACRAANVARQTERRVARRTAK